MTNPLTTTGGNRWKTDVLRNQLGNGATTWAKREKKVFSPEISRDPVAKGYKHTTKRRGKTSQGKKPTEPRTTNLGLFRCERKIPDFKYLHTTVTI